MEKAKITFLGTGSAVPTARRNHPATLLQFTNEQILFDCGEGTQRQFRKARINPCKLTRIFITHWHADHVLGLPGMLQTLMLNGYNKTLHIYGPKGTKKMMQLYLALFTHKHKISIKVNEITKNKVLETSDFRIIAEQMKHETPALAYSFEIKEKIRLNKAKLAKLKLGKGKHFQDLAKGKTIKIKNKAINPKSLNLIYKEPERKLTIIMDTLENSNTIKLAKNSDVLICESTYSKKEEKLAKEHFHLTSNQSAQIAKKAKTKSLYLVHLSQRYDKDNKEILKQAKKIFKNTKIPEDFNEIVF